MRSLIYIATLIVSLIFASITEAAKDPLPSWQDGKNKRDIIAFVQSVTDKKSKDYVPPKDRFVTFDNDGTLWVEQPIYTQMVFIQDNYKMFHKKKMDPIDAENALEYALPTTDITVDDYKKSAKKWLAQARHPRFKKHYTRLVYQPMLEMMDYLRKNNFIVYIVSGGGQDFIRAFAPEVYGVEPNYIIGSASKTDYVYQNNKPNLIKIRTILFVNDKQGKPEAINLFIGKKPLIAFGNSDGDRQMLEWTQSGEGKRLMVLIHHDDSEREYAYDVDSRFGKFSEALMTEAKQNNWHVISMKNDWKVVFPSDK